MSLLYKKVSTLGGGGGGGGGMEVYCVLLTLSTYEGLWGLVCFQATVTCTKGI